MAKSDKVKASVARDELAQLILDTKGKVFKVTFKRRSGGVRVMLASLNIAKGRVGGTGTLTLDKNNCIIVRDMQLTRKVGADSGKDIRAIPLEGVLRVVSGGVEYTVTD